MRHKFIIVFMLYALIAGNYELNGDSHWEGVRPWPEGDQVFELTVRSRIGKDDKRARWSYSIKEQNSGRYVTSFSGFGLTSYGGYASFEELAVISDFIEEHLLPNGHLETIDDLRSVLTFLQSLATESGSVVARSEYELDAIKSIYEPYLTTEERALLDALDPPFIEFGEGNEWTLKFSVITFSGALEHHLYKGRSNPFLIEQKQTLLALPVNSIPEVGYVWGVEDMPEEIRTRSMEKVARERVKQMPGRKPSWRAATLE